MKLERTGHVAQLGEGLPKVCKALSPISNTLKESVVVHSCVPGPGRLAARESEAQGHPPPPPTVS